ncbi:MAG: ATP-dependent dethiobiotin synthetase BioD [Bacteroides sp.]|nr:ATP-dependent dethiobiotin synthetase BioD [Bacteroides sp.]MBD5285893.1 ATP-dependent dethiobiotin synthetase BioD [Bacteroides sp.]
MSEVIFISGIDTDAGKTYMTGAYARMLMEQGRKVITQKFIQTGNEEFSEDIEVHRKIMGTGLLPEDVEHLTAPIIFSYPASAQLAARIDGKIINTNVIAEATAQLAARYDTVLIEGAGGLMVPITDNYFTIDYVKEHELPVILVTNGVLGSINHTVLSLEAIKHRGIKLKGVIYNTFFDKDKIIAEDTSGFIGRYLVENFPDAEYLIM